MRALIFFFTVLFSGLYNSAIADSLSPIIDTTKKASIPPTIHTLGVIKYNVHAASCCFVKQVTKEKVFPNDYIMIKTDINGIQLAEKNKDTFRLWINHICYTKIKPSYISPKDCTLIFKLALDTAATSPWQLYYSYPNYWTFSHEAVVSLGTFKTEFKNKNDVGVQLATTALWMVLTGYLLMALILIMVIFFGKGIIRDISLYSQNGVKISYNKNELTSIEKGIINVSDVPYSMAKFQFLFWLLIIFFSIIHIWAIEDFLTTPTGTVLLLLGISGSTFYIGRLLDLKVQTSPADTPPITASASVSDFISNNMKSKGFILDVLSDDHGICLHRLQLLIFTLFLGICFLWEVIYGLALPQFSDTMMLLMGISSGTYAGIKTTEK